MEEFDPYADFSDAELLSIVEELEAEDAQRDTPGVDRDVDVDVGSNEEQLAAWMAEVDGFGGRIASPAKKTLIQELSAGQLGQRVFLPTTEVFPRFPDSVLLAEVVLSTAVAMDVTFGYTNMKPEQQPIGLPALDQGNGFVRLTWGTPGSFKRVADIDGNRGWRRQFSASYMRVEYVPVDPSMSNTIPGSQPRDLGVAAMISPAIGSVSEVLTKTVYFGDIAAGSNAAEIIPRWATSVEIAGSWSALPSDYEVLLTDATVLAVQRFGNTGALAAFESSFRKWPVPQRAQRIFLLMPGAESVNRATAIFELAL